MKKELNLQEKKEVKQTKKNQSSLVLREDSKGLDRQELDCWQLMKGLILFL
jgi:hypothetical protein